MELARRLGLKVVGVGMPGHFIVRHVPAKGEAKLIDVYEGGKEMTREDAEKRVRAQYDRPLKDEDLAATGKKAILVRMLQNLLGLAQGDEDAYGMLRYLDAIVTITPDAGRERWMRAILRYNTRQTRRSPRGRRLAHQAPSRRHRAGTRGGTATAAQCGGEVSAPFSRRPEDGGVNERDQCRKCRTPVNTIARPCSSQAAMESASRIEPPGCTMAVTPARGRLVDVVAEREERIRRQHRAAARARRPCAPPCAPNRPGSSARRRRRPPCRPWPARWRCS